jgi:hypothetical protein
VSAENDDSEDKIEVSTDLTLRPAAIRHAAIIVADLYAIDVTYDGVRDTPRDDYARVLFEYDNPLACAVKAGGRDYSFGWLFTEADVPEILAQADEMIVKWTAAGERWGVSGG